jgi:hypothetical protein
MYRPLLSRVIKERSRDGGIQRYLLSLVIFVGLGVPDGACQISWFCLA